MLTHRPTSRPSHSHSIADAAGGLGSFRYRTALFVGAWRDHSEEAIDDAVRAGQARRGAPDRLVIRWLVKGRIETRDDAVPTEMPEAH